MRNSKSLSVFLLPLFYLFINQECDTLFQKQKVDIILNDTYVAFYHKCKYYLNTTLIFSKYRF